MAITPNQYELQGTGVRIHYSTSSIAGRAQLRLQKGRQTLDFSGNEIGVVETPVGALITVTIATIPDRSVTTFSFLLPAIDLAKAAAKQSFQTVSLITTRKTTIAGPPKGVQQTYKAIALRGSAQQVQFLAQRTAKA